MIATIRELIPWQEPTFIAQQLVEEWGDAGLVWLDGDKSNLGRWITLAVDPITHICCKGGPQGPKAFNPFEALRNLEPGHWSGWLSYEAGAWIEPNNPWKTDNISTLWMAHHDPVFKFDMKNREFWLEGVSNKRFQIFRNWLKKTNTQIIPIETTAESFTKEQSTKIPIDNWTWQTNRNEYIKQVNLLKDLIKEGDIFQANLSTCCTTSLPHGLSAMDIFYQIRNQCPAPFGGIIVASGAAEGEAIISASPERFLKMLPTGIVESRPIKGTRPRLKDLKGDSDMAIELICSEKDRAENIMIVDLLRNDLGKVCTPGSIKVPQLVGLESYSEVHHLTSVIQGCLQPNKTWVDLLEACWPGGSISGAPKLRACQRLYELEPTPRGPYCGSLLHLDWNGKFDSNILIRSLIVKGSQLRVHAGCGIVADSTPNAEADELTWKLMPLLKALA